MQISISWAYSYQTSPAAFGCKKKAIFIPEVKYQQRYYCLPQILPGKHSPLSRGFGRKQKKCQSCDWPLKTREPPIFSISKIEVPHWTSQDNAGVKHGSKPAPKKTNRSEVHRKNRQISPSPTNPQLPDEGWWKIGSLCKSLKNRWWVTYNVYKSPMNGCIQNHPLTIYYIHIRECIHSAKSAKIPSGTW